MREENLVIRYCMIVFSMISLSPVLRYVVSALFVATAPCGQGNISGYTLSARAAIIDHYYYCLAGGIDSPNRVHSYTVKSNVA